MHPRDAELFDWDDDNEAELETSEHPIKPWEAEEIVENGPLWVRNKNEGSGDWKMIGKTNGGRALTIVVTANEVNRSIRPITGWATTRGERTRYLGGNR